MKNPEGYKEVKTLQHGNATIYIYIPDLTEEERNKRIRNLEKALYQYGHMTKGKTAI